MWKNSFSIQFGFSMYSLYVQFFIIRERSRRLVSKAFSALAIPDHFPSTWGNPPYEGKWSGIAKLRKKIPSAGNCQTIREGRRIFYW
uniref:Uncharacterized protein n=1 Tax=Streptococcus thermophilus TaxID=1308 RepID=O30930_STRTR|nr:unknown protein [Streptococcus thermophilus]